MYEFFYNLSARPFQLMPDPRLLFESTDHKRALSYLLYGLERREGFVVITGDVGMGKTLLVQRLLGEPRTRAMSVARVAMANLDAGSLLPTVASAFGLPHKARSKIELLDDLVARLLPSQDRGAMLIVDEAQTCTPEALEELRAISNLQANGRALLQIFLVGQTDLRQILGRPNMAHLRQRIVASHQLHPLDADEVRAYIQHRLRMVGWSDKPVLTDGVYTGVHEWSRGVPRRINLLMDRFLLYGYLEQLETLSESDLSVVIGEFEEEFAGDNMATGEDDLALPDSPGTTSSADLGKLNARLDSLEQSLASALGRARAAELIDQHQANAESQAVVAAQMRLARLESLVAGLKTQAPPASKPAASAEKPAQATAEPAQPTPEAARAAPERRPEQSFPEPAGGQPQPQSAWSSSEAGQPVSSPEAARGQRQPQPAWSAPEPAGANPESKPARTAINGGRPEEQSDDDTTRQVPADAGARRRGNLVEAIDSLTPSDVSLTHRGVNGARRRLFSRRRKHGE